MTIGYGKRINKCSCSIRRTVVPSCFLRCLAEKRLMRLQKGGEEAWHMLRQLGKMTIPCRLKLEHGSACHLRKTVMAETRTRKTDDPHPCLCSPAIVSAASAGNHGLNQRLANWVSRLPPKWSEVRIPTLPVILVIDGKSMSTGSLPNLT